MRILFKRQGEAFAIVSEYEEPYKHITRIRTNRNKMIARACMSALTCRNNRELTFLFLFVGCRHLQILINSDKYPFCSDTIENKEFQNKIKLV